MPTPSAQCRGRAARDIARSVAARDPIRRQTMRHLNVHATMTITKFAFPTTIHFGAGARKLVGPHLLETGSASAR